MKKEITMMYDRDLYALKFENDTLKGVDNNNKKVCEEVSFTFFNHEDLADLFEEISKFYRKKNGGFVMLNVKDNIKKVEEYNKKIRSNDEI